MSLIQLQHAHKAYFGKTILNDLNLSLEAGERLALLGDNGTGKTTLLRILAGEETLDAGVCITSDRLRVAYLSQNLETEEGVERVWHSPRWLAAQARLHEATQALQQASEADYARVSQAYQSALQAFEAEGGYAYEYDLRTALAGLGLPEGIADRPLSACSGGERMRISLAKHLLSRPDLLLLDEPTNHLDLQAIEWLINYLKQFKGTLCVVSHDRYFLDAIATRCAFLRNGQVRIFSGHYAQALQLKQAEDAFIAAQVETVTQTLEREREISQTLRSHRDISGWKSRLKRVERLEDQLALLRAQQDRQPHGLNLRLETTQFADSPNRILLQAKDLAYGYDQQMLFSEVHLTLRKSDKLVLIGPNGSGKTTLMEILSGRKCPLAGQLKWTQDLSMAYLTQTVTFEPEGLTCLETLLLEAPQLTEERARSALAQLGFRSIDVYKRTDVLSGGERARLALCCLLQAQPALLCLDEPTNHLDIHSRELLEAAIQSYSGAVIAVTHDRFFIDRFANRYVALTPNGLIDCPSVDLALKRSAQALQAQRLQQQALAPEPVKSSALPVEEPAPPRAAPPLNPVKRRKLQAQCQQHIQQLEATLAALESALDELEAGAAQATGPEYFEEMAKQMQQKEKVEEALLEALLELEQL